MVETPARFDASGRLLAQSPEGDNLAPLSITEISGMLKRTVEDRFGHVRLRGEISGFKRAASGHVYLALKDENAVIDGVMWKGGAQRLAFAPQDGIEVVATGKITTYPGRSKYQIVIETMELAGEGALMQLFERLKAQLAAEGLFDPAKRRPIPLLPRVIGVVTSPTGAVIRDILHRLADRCPSRVIVWPVLVQGEGAAAQVANAVRGFGAIAPGGPVPRPDLIIVARGGGSIEDLWAFNEEAVVRAVAASPIPVISAVGHETDTTLCDFAADMRAPTPTAAAEMAVPVRAELLAHFSELGARMQRSVHRRTELARERLEAQRRLLPRPETLLGPQRQRADDLGERLKLGLTLRIARARHELSDVSGALRPPLLRGRLERARQQLGVVRLSPMLLERRAKEAEEKLGGLWRVAQSLDPTRPMRLGFALVTGPDGALIRSKDVARATGQVTLSFADGAVPATVDGATPRPARTPRGGVPEAGQQDLFG